MKRLLTSLLAAFAATAAMADTYVWNTNVTSGNASEPSNWLVNGVAATVAPGASDDVIVQGSMTNQWQNIAVTLDAAFTFKSLTLSENVHVSGGSQTLTAGKLVLGACCPKLTCNSSSVFGKFESTGACAVLETNPDTFTITDTSGVKVYNGVAPQFAATSNNGGPCEILKLTAEGKLTEVTAFDNTDDIQNAGENDTVYLTDASSNVVLTDDVTINALKMHSSAKLDLGGHTLTVKSGVIRPRRNGNWVNCGTIENGTLKVCDQFFYINGVGAEAKHLNVALDTTWNADPFKQVFDYRIADYNRDPIPYTDMSRFFGAYRARVRKGLNSFHDATNTVFDTGYGNWIQNGYTSDHNKSANLRGIAGNSSVRSQDKFNGKLWLGDDVDNDNWEIKSFVVGPNGYLVPGGLAYDGFREGSLRFDDTAMDLRAYTKLIFKTGSHLVATVRDDGRATSVTTSGTSNYRCKVTINGGNLDIVEAGKVKPGTWTLMRTVDPVTGHDGKFFDSVTDRYKVKYNVEVVENETTYYEIQVTKNPIGTVIVVK